MIRYYSAPEVRDIWRIPIAEVYRLASEHRWRRVGDRRRPVLYNAEDVDKAMNRGDGGPQPNDA